MALCSMTWYCLQKETAIFAYFSWVTMKQSSTANLTMKETFAFSPNSEAIQFFLSISTLLNTSKADLLTSFYRSYGKRIIGIGLKQDFIAHFRQ